MTNVKRLLLAAVVATVSLPFGAAARQLTSSVTELNQIPRIRPLYPVPDEPNMLFYVERSANANTVIYAARLDTQGAVDTKSPIDAYWRWYNVDGKKKGLNFIERLMAYGVTAKRPDVKGAIPFTIAALPERTIMLDLDEKRRPEAVIQIGNHTVKLAYVYLEVVDGGLMPSVPSLDLFGTDKSSGKIIHEHIVQN